MYHIIIVCLLIITVFLPIGAIAGNTEDQVYFDEDVSNSEDKYARYDVVNRQTYQVDGNSMKHLGFGNGVLVDVVPVSSLKVGDITAFECSHDACDGAYIKELTKKEGSCYWFEGRKDIWKEGSKKKKSMDSRTTYGWLCNEDVEIYGVAFLQNNA